jgi:hypothetical protein
MAETALREFWPDFKKYVFRQRPAECGGQIEYGLMSALGIASFANSRTGSD